MRSIYAEKTADGSSLYFCHRPMGLLAPFPPLLQHMQPVIRIKKPKTLPTDLQLPVQAPWLSQLCGRAIIALDGMNPFSEKRLIWFINKTQGKNSERLSLSKSFNQHWSLICYLCLSIEISCHENYSVGPKSVLMKLELADEIWCRWGTGPVTGFKLCWGHTGFLVNGQWWRMQHWLVINTLTDKLLVDNENMFHYFFLIIYLPML